MYEELVKQCIEQGGSVNPNMTYRNSGMFATATINKGEVLLQVPASMFLTLKSIPCKPHPAFGENHPYLSLAWAMCVDQNRGEASPFHHWYTGITDPQHIALLTDDELTVLKPYGQIWKRVQDKKRMIDTVRGALNGEDLNKMCRAMAIVFTRAWNLKEKWLQCTPLMDLFNHRYDADGFGIATDQWTLRASKDYSAGDEIFITYGRYISPTDVAISWGFFDNRSVLHRLPCNIITVKAKSANEFRNIKLAAEKFNLKLGLEGSDLKVNIPCTCVITKHGPNQKLIDFMMLYLGIDVSNVKSHDKFQIMKTIQQVIKSLKSVYPDSKTLKCPNEMERPRMIEIIMRAAQEEATIIENALAWTRNYIIALIDSP